MPFYPFSDGDSYATFRAHREKVEREIDSLENEYVLKASEAELEQFYVAQITLAPLVLNAEDYYIAGQKGTQIDVSNDFRRATWGSERAYVKGTAIEIAIPFDGDPNLFRIRASTFSSSGYPEIDVRGNLVIMTFQFADDAANPEQLKSEIGRHVGSLSQAVSYLARDVESHNREGAQAVRNAIQRKKQKALSATNAIAALGIPIRKRDQPATFTVPARRREQPVSRPQVATEKYSPEPTLDQREFDHILSVLRSMALVIERSPGAFSTLDEEEIRTHFLLQLNGHYEGSATGETFNASGKTDILIRVDNRNVFTAECKFWKGEKSFNAAIDQLLSYLSWRDSKCALLVFNTTKDSSAVRDKMHHAVIARPEYRKTLAHGPQTDSRYILTKQSDPGREIQLCTMLFDIPRGEASGASG